GGGGVLRRQRASDGVPGVRGGGVVHRQRSGGVGVQDGGGPAAQGGGDALGGRGGARAVPHPRPVPQREGTVGGVLAAPARRLNGRPTNSTAAHTNGKADRLTVAALADAKRLSPDFLTGLGLTDLPKGGVGIPYYDATGTEVAVKQRTALHAREGSYWPKGKPLAAYGSWR